MEDFKLMKKLVLSASMMAMLAACGGGGDEPNAFAFEDPNEAVDRFLGVLVAASDVPETNFVALQPLGTVSYQGLTTVSLDDGFEEQQMLGTFDLEANFAGDQITGSTSDFVGIEPVGSGGDVISTGEVSGTLSITNGTATDIAGAGGFDADIAGTLRDGGTTITIDTTLEGSFRGAAAEYVVAGSDSSATAEVVTVSSGASTQDLDVIILGERQ